MSYDVTTYSSGEPTQRLDRRTSRAISRHRSGAMVRVSAVDADTDVAAAQLDVLTMLTGQAMTSVARVAQAQRHLEQLVPEASGHLAYLAQDHLLGMGDVLANARRNMRRR